MRGFIRVFLRTAAVVAVVLFVCVAMLEAVLRINGRLPSNVTDGIFVQHGGSYRLGKDIDKVTRWSFRTFLIRTNALGYRDSVIGPVDLEARPCIVFLGDSVTFGNGADFENTFVGMLRSRVESAGLQIQNCAVGGHHLADQIEVLKEYLAVAPRPPRAVIVCMTDGLINTFDLKTEGILVKDGYLFNAKSWKMAYIRTIMGNASAAFCFFRDGIRKAQARWLKPPARDIPPYLKLFSKNSRLHDPAVIQEFHRSLIELELYCQNAGTRVVYAYLPLIDTERLADLVTQAGKSPADFDSYYYEMLMKTYCRSRNAALIDLEPRLDELSRKGIPWTFGDDPHYDTPAHAIVADSLFESLQAASLLGDSRSR